MLDTQGTAKIVQRLGKLSNLQLGQVERLMTQLEFLNSKTVPLVPQINFNWPHAPTHRLGEGGVFMVTGGTMYKEHYFNSAWALDLMVSKLLELANEYRWQLEAWACFSNHYHFIVRDDHPNSSLTTLINQLHTQTANGLNQRDGELGRSIWYNYFDTQLTFQASYLARLSYVHQNPVRHRLVPVASQYKWCSAAWFEQNATVSQIKTVYSFKTERLRVPDDYEVWKEGAEVNY